MISDVTNWNELLLTSGEAPAVDTSLTARLFTMLPGKVAVEMHPSETYHGVYLPSSGRLLSCIGTVLAVGPGVALTPGDTVLCRQDDGLWFDHFEYKDYKSQGGRVKFFGIAGTRPEHVEGFENDRGEYQLVPWNESIPALIKDGNITPTKGNVKVKRERWVSHLELPSNMSQYTDVVTVQSGPKEGARATFKLEHPSDMLTFGLGGEEDYAIIPEGAIDAYLH